MESNVLENGGISHQFEFNVSRCSSNDHCHIFQKRLWAKKQMFLKDMYISLGRQLSPESICPCKPNYLNSFILQNLFSSLCSSSSPSLCFFSSPVPSDKSVRGSRFFTKFTSGLWWDCISSGNQWHSVTSLENNQQNNVSFYKIIPFLTL